MRVNATMLTFGRSQLTKQALESFHATTGPEVVLTTLDDGTCGTGVARNRVIQTASDYNRGRYLYLSDNDVIFTPGWLPKLVYAYETVRPLGFRILGGYNHPFHQPLRKYPVFIGNRTCEVHEVNAVACQSWLLEWETWDKYGPFVETPVGKVRQSEDHEWCQRVRKDGFKVGHLVPPVVLPTSRHDTFGELIPGHELVPDIPGVIVE